MYEGRRNMRLESQSELGEGERVGWSYVNFGLRCCLIYLGKMKTRNSTIGLRQGFKLGERGVEKRGRGTDISLEMSALAVRRGGELMWCVIALSLRCQS